jgi:hypothetical protein
VRLLEEKYPLVKLSPRNRHLRENTPPINSSMGKIFPRDKSP